MANIIYYHYRCYEKCLKLSPALLSSSFSFFSVFLLAVLLEALLCWRCVSWCHGCLRALTDLPSHPYHITLLLTMRSTCDRYLWRGKHDGRRRPLSLIQEDSKLNFHKMGWGAPALISNLWFRLCRKHWKTTGLMLGIRMQSVSMLWSTACTILL